MKIFKRGGFIILDDEAGNEYPITVALFDYSISGTNITLLDMAPKHVKDTGEVWRFKKALTDIKNGEGVAVGDAAAIGVYLANLTEGGSASADSPSHQELTNPSATEVSGWKKLSFVCSGAITVTINSNAIVYPYTLGTTTIYGAELAADTVTANNITFNGTGTVLITTQ